MHGRTRALVPPRVGSVTPPPATRQLGLTFVANLISVETPFSLFLKTSALIVTGFLFSPGQHQRRRSPPGILLCFHNFLRCQQIAQKNTYSRCTDECASARLDYKCCYLSTIHFIHAVNMPMLFWCSCSSFYLFTRFSEDALVF